MKDNGKAIMADSPQYINDIYVGDEVAIKEAELFAVLAQNTGDKHRPTVLSYYRDRNFPLHGEVRRSFDGGEILKMGPGPVHIIGTSDYITNEAPGSNICYEWALKKFYDQIKNTDLLLGVDIAESKQTKALAKDIAKMIKNANKAIYKLKNLKYLGPASGAYLAFVFGIMPLIQSLSGLYAIVNSAAGPQKKKIDVRATVITSSDDLSEFSPYFPGVTMARSMYRSDRCQIAGFLIQDNPAVSLQNQLGLQPLPSTYWEQLPLSFVADWFIDVGSYLQQVEMATGSSGWTFANGYITRTTKYSIWDDINFEPEQASSLGVWTDGKAQRSRFYISCDRNVLYAMPYPPLPSWKGTAGLTGGKVLSFGALLSQFAASKKWVPKPSVTFY